MDQLYLKYKDEVAFFTVYIREAHPTDGWRMRSNDRFGIAAAQPTTFQQRSDLANRCSTSLKLLCPMLIDLIDDKVAEAYSAFPDRLYVLDSKGRVAYKGGRGPFGYRPREMEQALNLLLLDEAAGE